MMAASGWHPSSSSTRSAGGGPVLHRQSSPAFALTTAAAFSPRSPSRPLFHHGHHHRRSASPARINIAGGPTTTVRSQIIDRRDETPSSSSRRRNSTCACSPTTHPGSFRCGLHRRHPTDGHRSDAPSSPPSSRLNTRRSAMVNSLVRIGTVEGDLVRRSLASLIRPSSHHQKRREGFQPRPSRLSIMSKA